jgi:hypothetical protein
VRVAVASTAGARARPAEQARAVIERVIAHLKNWRILHTDYRRPIGSFATTISAAVGLLFYSLA